MMKINVNITVFVMTLVFLLSACKKEKPELDPPGSKLGGINANWTLVEVEQIDINNVAEPTLDVSDAYLNNSNVEFKFNSESFSYEVQYGNTPAFFGNSGSWKFDDNEFPTRIELFTDLSENINLPLVRTIRPQDPFLIFGFERTCGNDEKPYIKYQYKFIRK